MELDARKRRILHAIVDDYVHSAEPVGSRTVARRYGLGVSSATIRNEMADLEELGYLEQPHTSAGRIPSQKGYRFYVDRLMEVEQLSEKEQEQLRAACAAGPFPETRLIRRMVRMLSRLTRYVSLILGPEASTSTVRRVYLAPVQDSGLLLLLVTNTGAILSRVVEARGKDPADIETLSRLFGEKLRGFTLREISYSLFNGIRVPSEWRIVVDHIVDMLEHETEKPGRFFVGGAQNLFDQPEFRDVSKIRPLLGLLEEEESLFAAFGSAPTEEGVTVTIGSENPYEQMRGCSVVSARYQIDDTPVGTVCVFGPTRMRYGRVVSAVDFAARLLSDGLTRVKGS